MIENVSLRKRLAALFMAFAVTLSCLVGIVPVGVTVEAAGTYITMPINNDDYDHQGHGFIANECTAFCSWRIIDRHKIPFGNDYNLSSGKWGNASNWGIAAKNAGIEVNSTPAVGSIAWWRSGHVAWVSEVFSNGDITIEEYNYTGAYPDGNKYNNRYFSRTITPWFNGITNYIHFEKLAAPVEKEYGTPMTSGAGKTIPDGDYYIACWDSDRKNYIMTVAGTYSGSDYKGCDGENVQLYSSLGDPVQAFHIEFVDNDGFYKITNSYSGNRSLDVRDGWDYGIGAPLQIMPYVKNNPAQLWSIEQVDNGEGSAGYGMEGITYRIRSKCNGYYIDLPGGEVGNDKHLQLWKKDETVNKVNEQSRIYLAIQLFKKNIPDSLEINVNYFFIRLTFISLAYDNFINQIKKHILI